MRTLQPPRSPGVRADYGGVHTGVRTPGDVLFTPPEADWAGIIAHIRLPYFYRAKKNKTASDFFRFLPHSIKGRAIAAYPIRLVGISTNLGVTTHRPQTRIARTRPLFRAGSAHVQALHQAARCDASEMAGPARVQDLVTTVQIKNLHFF